jgi:2-succinyl-6-hydroxy-2,4-cyclohexadiene-1-carboxylate synthase
LVLAHGFTQTGQVWGSLDTRLAAHHQVVLVDMPGHGRSDRVRATLAGGAGLLADVGGRATYLGYSMGARFCLHLALARPGVVEGLVLISGTAGIEDPDERRARRRSDEALAEDLDPSGGPTRSPVPVESFLRRWLENPMFAGISPAAGGLTQRLTNTGAGLASSLRLAGTGTQRPRWASLPRLRMPVLIITGERDAKFTALGQRMATSIGPHAVHAVVARTGHAPHLERPGAVAELIHAHLEGPAAP